MAGSLPHRSTRPRTPSQREGGFTLVEVMVVVLIIGILISVGLPTFLSARTRGQNAATRSTLSTAATAALTVSDFGSDYSLATPSALAAFEPSLTYVDDTTESTGPNEVSVDSSTPGEWTGTSRSGSGTCVGVELTPLGRTFFESGSCSADIAGPPVAVVPTNLALSGGVTAGSGTTAQNLIDGNLSTRGGTVWEQQQWFSFDLGANSHIEQILLYNRTDCCASRTRDLTLYVSDDPISTDQSTAAASGAQSFFIEGQVGSPTTLAIGTSGRYIVIFGSGPATSFQEIEIMGIAS